MKLKVLADGLLQQAEILGDGDVFLAFRDEDGDWAREKADRWVQRFEEFIHDNALAC